MDFPAACHDVIDTHRLLHVRNANCRYREAEATWNEAQVYQQQLADKGCNVNRATLLSEYCALLFAKSQYDEVSH